MKFDNNKFEQLQSVYPIAEAVAICFNEQQKKKKADTQNTIKIKNAKGKK